MVAKTDIQIKQPDMSGFILFLFDKWAMVGFTGMALNIFSLFKGAELPEVTGFSGLLIVAVAVFQKIRDDLRKQEKHKMQMRVVEKMLNQEIEIDKAVIAEFMEVKSN